MGKSFEKTVGEKQSCREVLCEIAKTRIPSVKCIFTLPSKEALCYKTFLRHFPKSTIVGVEKDTKIYEDLMQNPDFTFNVENVSVKEYAEKATRGRHFDVVFLDYFSYLNEDIKNDIKLFVGNDNIVHPGTPFVLGITLLKSSRGGDFVDIVKDLLWKTSAPKNDLDTVRRALHGYIATELSPESIELVEAREYKAAAKSSAMYFFVFIINK